MVPKPKPKLNIKVSMIKRADQFAPQNMARRVASKPLSARDVSYASNEIRISYEGNEIY